MNPCVLCGNTLRAQSGLKDYDASHFDCPTCGVYAMDRRLEIELREARRVGKKHVLDLLPGLQRAIDEARLAKSRPPLFTVENWKGEAHDNRPVESARWMKANLPAAEVAEERVWDIGQKLEAEPKRARMAMYRADLADGSADLYFTPGCVRLNERSWFSSLAVTPVDAPAAGTVSFVAGDELRGVELLR